MTRTWPALSIRLLPVPPDRRAQIEDLVSVELHDAEATAVQPLETVWRVFFATGEARDRAAQQVCREVPHDIEVTAEDVPDEDWARRSQDHLQAVRIGRIVVAPPWAGSTSVDAGATRVVILPSMGFGTGHHASTRLCIALLQLVELRAQTVLDVGTGSGVLAIAARLLGARSVLAVDDDRDALESARDNLDLNRLVGGVELRLADIRNLNDLRADVVTANLTGSLLARTAGRLAGAVGKDGCLIVSGITVEEEAAVRGAFEPHLQLEHRLEEDGWVAWLLRPPRTAR